MTDTGVPSTWTVRPAPPLPGSPDDPGRWAYEGMAECNRLSELATWGWSDLYAPAHVLVPLLRPDAYTRQHVWVAVIGDGGAAQDVVGHVTLRETLVSNQHSADLSLVVRPDHRGRGIGSRLLEEAVGQATADGRTTLQAHSGHSPEPPPGPDALESPVGSGRVARDDAAVRFAQRHGFALEQVARYSVLELGHGAGSVERAALLADARTHAGDDYRTLTWLDEVPEDRLDDVAELCTRMSTDVPLGGLDAQEDPWDADRVLASLRRSADAGLHHLMTVAEHVPSGRLVAFSVIEVPYADVPFGFQEDTLVVREHRGRRLGMLVKTVNLEALTARRPGVRRLHTWNAQENDHMLAINVALGFRQAGVSAAWQRVAPAV